MVLEGTTFLVFSVTYNLKGQNGKQYLFQNLFFTKTRKQKQVVWISQSIRDFV